MNLNDTQKADSGQLKPNDKIRIVLGDDDTSAENIAAGKRVNGLTEPPPPQDKSSDAGEGYRILKVGEVIQAGDTSRYKRGGAGWPWADACVCVGMKVEEDDGNFYRRKISVQHAPQPPKGLPEIPEGWRELSPNEVVQDGDMYMGDMRKRRLYGPDEWSPADCWGHYAGSYETLVYIRPKQNSGAGAAKAETRSKTVPNSERAVASTEPAPEPIPNQPPAESRLDAGITLAKSAEAVICKAVIELGYREAEFKRGCFRAELQHGECSYQFSTCQNLIETSDDAQTETDRLVTLARKFREAVDSMKV